MTLKYKWKKCITGSYDFVNELDEPVFHIFRSSLGLSKFSGQVFIGDEHAELIYEDSLEIFIIKSTVMAKNSGWDIDFSKINLSPDFSSIEEYESLMFLNELSEEDKEFWRSQSPHMESIKNEIK